MKDKNPEYYHSPESVDEYMQLAEGVDGALLIDRFKTFLSPDSSLLELGSGPGTDWGILNQNFDVTGSDISQEFLRRLKIKYPVGEFIEMDASSLTTDQSFDGIYSNKVLHHLKNTELRSSIKRQAAILNPAGLVCHSFWKGEGDEIFKGMYVNYHSSSGLRDLFGDSFDILVLEPYREFEEGDSLLLIGRKK
jgi:cyclopropane fatty-acyl-phospholipid synthase-like methyltransferase